MFVAAHEAVVLGRKRGCKLTNQGSLRRERNSAPRPVRQSMHMPTENVPDRDVFTPNILAAMGTVAKALGNDLSPIEVSGPEEFETAFASWAEQTVSAVVVIDIFTSQSPAVAAIATKRRIASIGRLELATAGGLIGYGVDFPAMYRRAAIFGDKTLKGAKPGDIPIELATKFRTSVNLKTEQALAIDIPPTLLGAADEVIE